MQFYGKYPVSRPFGWLIINDNHENANMQMVLTLPRSLDVQLLAMRIFKRNEVRNC
jgi:hypothetical protein